MEKEVGRLRRQVLELTSEIESHQLAREHADQRKNEQER